MTKEIVSVLKTIAVFGVIIAAFLFILLVVDAVTAGELRDGLLKIAQIAGIIAVTSIIVILIIGSFKAKE